MIKNRYIKQFYLTDCGLACLGIISSCYGKYFSVKYIEDRCYKNKIGTSFLNLKDSAVELGFNCRGVKTSLDRLVEINLFPCIIYWNQKHFVVLYSVDNKSVIVIDPAKGRLKYKKNIFLKCWTGNDNIDSEGFSLLLKPTDVFYSKNNNFQNKIRLASLFNYVFPYYKSVIKIIIALVFTGLISMILPFLTQLIVDSGVKNKDLHFVGLIFFAQIILILGQSFSVLIHKWLLLHVASKISVTLVSNFLSKLMRLKIAFFDSRLIGDIIQRLNDYNRLESFLTSSFINIVTIVLSFFIFGSVILKYSISILCVFIFGSVLYIFWILFFLKKRANIDYMRFQEMSVNYSNIIQLITGIQDIKLNNCEIKKRWEWEKTQVNLHEVNLMGLKLSQTQQIGSDFIDNLKNVLISFLAVNYVINDNLSLGMFFAIQFTIGQLNVPLHQSVGLIQAWQDMKLSLQRINEIYERDEEDDSISKTSVLQKEFDIILDNVYFRYGGVSSPYVLQNINITIQKNKTTAIVGSSGSGKTTLLKLILGYYEPIKGEIKLNNLNISAVNKSDWRNKCAIVMQESFIFSDTIKGNIALSDSEEPNMEKVVKSAKIANIDDYILSLPLKYDTKIGQEGRAISTGQKQRLLIARAIYKDANFVFLDEATNSLDATNEKNIISNLNTYFENKTVLIIAHRLSTVKNADNIIVLDGGKVVEEGSHNSLVKNQSYYFRLIKDQLELGV